MQEIQIGEHTFTINTDCQGREGWARFKQYGALMQKLPDGVETFYELDYDTAKEFAMLGCVAWTCDGLPQDPDAWDKLHSQCIFKCAHETYKGFSSGLKN